MIVDLEPSSSSSGGGSGSDTCSSSGAAAPSDVGTRMVSLKLLRCIPGADASRTPSVFELWGYDGTLQSTKPRCVSESRADGSAGTHACMRTRQ